MYYFIQNHKGNISFKAIIIGLVFVLLLSFSSALINNQSKKELDILDILLTFDIKVPDNYSQALTIDNLDHLLSIQPVDAKSVESIEMGNSVKYTDAYQNTDVELVKYPDKVKESLILKTPDHPDKFIYELNLNDFLWEKDSEGNIILRMKEKQEAQAIPSDDGTEISAERMKQYIEEYPQVFKIPAPFMIDKQGKQSDIKDVEIILEDNRLVLIPNPAWLESHQYPIIIDPTIETIGKPVREISSERTYNSITFKNSNGSHTSKFHIGHIHYLDENNTFKAIDTSLIEDNNGWYQNQASYHLRVPKYSNDWIVFNDMFENEEQTIRMRPVTQSVLGQLVTDEQDVWYYKKVVYSNAFDNNIDLEVISTNIAFKKLIKINQLPAHLNQDLEFDFEIDLPENVTILTEQGQWDKKSPLRTKGQVKIGQTYLRKFSAWDSSGQVINIEIELYQKNNKLYFRKIIPQEFLEKAVYPVYSDADVTYYAGTGDGYVEERDGNWDACHDATVGLYTGNSLTYNVARTADEADGDDWRIHRAFVPVDTSALPDSTEISAATFSIFIYQLAVEDNGTYDYIRLVQTSQASTTTLSTDDFEQCGAINNPTAGATDLDMSDDLTNGEYNTFTLNATGKGWISTSSVSMLGVRQGHDASDHRITINTENKIQFYSSEQTGTSQDPYLSVTYTSVAPTITSVSDSPDPAKTGTYVTFSVDWNDEDIGEQVKIHICKTDAITASTQSCDGGSWCDLNFFTTNDPASCTYFCTKDDIAGSPITYYAFVCDYSNNCSTSSTSTFSVVVGIPSVNIQGTIKLEGKMKIR